MDVLKSAIHNKDIKKKFLFTLMCIVLFRIGASIPLPIVKLDLMKTFVEKSQFFSMYDLISGGNLANFSLFALGISPYITASIVINLLTLAVPALEELSEEGELGRKKIKKYTKLLGLTLAFMQSLVLFLVQFRSIFIKDSFSFILFAASIATFGVYLLILMDSAIEKKGVGKGSAIIICCSILSKMPTSIKTIIKSKKSSLIIPIVILSIILLITVVVAVQQAIRKVHITYAKHSLSKSNIALHKSYLPLKINQSSITPVIFAQTLLTVPTMIATIASENIADKLYKVFNPTTLTFNLLLVLLIVFFNYFYTSVAFDVEKIAENLKKANGFIAGVRPGEKTAEFLGTITNRLVFVGNIFLIAITLLPTILNVKANISVALLGTSLLIVTSTIIDIIKQVTAELTFGKNRSFFDFE